MGAATPFETTLRLPMTDWLVTAAGAAIVAVALRDVFHTLFHPGGEGSLSRRVLRGIWRAFHARPGRGALTLAGPVGFVAVIVVWTTLLIVGFGLVYWPQLDGSFTVVSNLERSANTGFLDSVYFSGVTLATLGYGDIAPATTASRIVAIVEGVVGLALLTAAVSWLLSIYSALQRRRTLAGVVSAVSAGGRPTEQMLEQLAVSLQSVRADFVQHSAAYYFHARDRTLVLPAVLPALARLGEGESAAAQTLTASLDALARTIGENFVGRVGTHAVIAAYRDDHRVADG